MKLLKRIISRIAKPSSNDWRFTVTAPTDICTNPFWGSETNIVLAWVTKDDRQPINLSKAHPSNLSFELQDYLFRKLKQASVSSMEVQIYSGLTNFFPLFPSTTDINQVAHGLRHFDRNLLFEPSEVSSSCPVIIMGKNIGLAAFIAFPKDSSNFFESLENGSQQATAHLIAGGFIVGETIFDFNFAPFFGELVKAIATRTYERIFASYSRKDKDIVETMDSILNALGHGELLWDTKVLRAGEDWSERIFQEIKSADSFQLFWSENARASEHVRREWEYALELNRKRFIKPVFWDDPLPAPPKELEHIHFSRIKPIIKNVA